MHLVAAGMVCAGLLGFVGGPGIAAAGAAPASAAAPAPAPLRSLPALAAQIDTWVQTGYEEPAVALAALDAELGRQPSAPAIRMLQLGRGLVAAAAADQAETEAALAALTSLKNDPLVAGDLALVRAVQADIRGGSTPAAAQASAARDAYAAACPSTIGCDYRSSWRAAQLLARHEDRRGRRSAARDSVLAAIDIARTAGDVGRQAWATAQAADIDSADGNETAAARLLEQAQRLAVQDGSPIVQARVRVHEQRMLTRRGHLAGARSTAETGLALALKAGAPRLAALFRANLSDIYVKSNRPLDALKAIEMAMPVTRRFRDRRAEVVLMHNAALAQVALGQVESARRTLDEVLKAHRAGGNPALEAEALREFADAYAAAGRLRDALALYHRERKLEADNMAANRDAALAELRQRFDREAQQRRRDQLERDNALMDQQIDNRAAAQKVWAAAAVLVALAVAMLVALLRRVRAINRRLAHNQAFLRAQSERDPLTGLTNRRGLHERAAADGLDKSFVGALLLVDIDHFKRVNDGHGHATGDLVLVEVARRLRQVVRDDDLVVRWGGEEFLVFMPAVGQAQAQALAGRVLQVLGGEPVALPGDPLRVTASVGYACCPLPGAPLPLTLERAVNLADMALYTAKSQGRNRAVGIAGARVEDDAALRQVEADFDQAWRDGRIALQVTPGPDEAAPHDAAPAPPAPAPGADERA